MMATLRLQGQLEEKFIEILQKFISANLTGRLLLHFENAHAQIFIRTGWVIHAELENSTDTAEVNRATGTQALNQCLDVQFGDYRFEAGFEANARTITESFSRIAVGRQRTLQHKPDFVSQVSTDPLPSNPEHQPLSSLRLAGLKKVVIESLGPAGGLILEDAADELGWTLEMMPNEKLGQLLEGLRVQVDTTTLARLNAALKKGGFEE